jgi:hypothetical protein
LSSFKEVRESLRSSVASGLQWHPARVSWQTEPQAVIEECVRLSIVSDIEEGERETLEGIGADHRTQVQVQIESSISAERAQDYAQTLRNHFRFKSTRTQLAVKGVGIVQQAGPVRDGSYLQDDTEISASIFEIGIRWNEYLADENLQTSIANTIHYTGNPEGVPVDTTVVRS